MAWARPTVTLPPANDHALKVKHVIYPGWSQRYLLISDCHWDSPECYIKLLHRHLQEAKDTNALIIDNGDFFEVIGGAGDKRGSKGSVIEEHQHVDYLDQVVNSAVEEFYKYADNFLQFGTGNHDWAITIKKETDIKRRFVEELNGIMYGDDADIRRAGQNVDYDVTAPIHNAGYTSWIRFMFEGEGARDRSSLKMKLEHGEGGNSPVTKGVIGASRRMTRTQGATFFVSGHIHESWQMPYVVEQLNDATSRVEQRLCQHIQLASYKQDFRNDGVGTWIMQRAGHPRPIGGAWLEFSSKDGKKVDWFAKQAIAPSDYPMLQDYLRGKARVDRTQAA